jgi:regulator of protease activity HflC (stomatin/prohibitin superfamily)
MFLLILGILIFLAANTVSQALIRYQNPDKIKNGMRLLSFLVMGLGVMTSCVKQIDAGYIGVQSLFGKIQEKSLGSGLNFVNPLVSVSEVDVRTQNYTMSGVENEGDKQGDDAIRVLTKDGLEVTIDLSVLYRVNATNAPQLVKKVGIDFKDKIIRPLARTKIRDNAVYYDAVELYSTKRDEFQQRIFKDIDKEFNNRGLILENLLIRNIALPQTVKLTIESKINAEQEAQKMQFVLQKEQQEAERKRVEARGIADYQKILNEGLTDKQIQYEQIKAYKEIATSTNSKVIFMPSKGNVIFDAK